MTQIDCIFIALSFALLPYRVKVEHSGYYLNLMMLSVNKVSFVLALGGRGGGGFGAKPQGKKIKFDD